MKKNFKVSLGPLEYAIHVLYLYSEEELSNYGQEHFDEGNLERDNDSAAEVFPISSNGCILDLHNKLSKSNFYDLGSLVHESEHCLLMALRSLGVHTHTEENEEIYCYIVSFIFREICKELFNKGD